MSSGDATKHEGWATFRQEWDALKTHIEYHHSGESDLVWKMKAVENALLGEEANAEAGRMSETFTPTCSGATPGAYNWIKEAVEVLTYINRKSDCTPEWMGVLDQIDTLLSGVPCEPKDLGFNSQADRYARAWHALNEGRSTPSARVATGLMPVTRDEVSAYRDLFRRELDKNMNNSSGSPSTEAHAVALQAFVNTRNKGKL